MAMTRLELTTRLAMGPMPGQQSIRDPSAWVISSSRLALADSQSRPQGNKRKYVEQSDWPRRVVIVVISPLPAFVMSAGGLTMTMAMATQ